MDRQKNAKRNIIFGFGNKLVSIIFPFITRFVMINTLGAEFLGLSSLFTSILQVLNLAELGFSEAIIYNMYEPVAKSDTKKLCALLNMYRKVYRKIGLIILAVGILILPTIPNLINGSYPKNVNIYFLYLIYLFNTVISYFLFAYKGCLLYANMRNDIVSNIDAIVKIILNLMQIAILVVFRNYYIFLIVMPICTIMNNLITSALVDKKYPNIKCCGEIDAKSKEKIKYNVAGLAIQKVCATTRNSLDSIFITAFLGLVMTAIYNNYYLIMNGIVVLSAVPATAINTVIGNKIATESVEDNYRDLLNYNFIYMWIAGVCAICLAVLYQPFMTIWFGREYLLDYKCVIGICIYYYALKLGDVRWNYTSGAGIFWQQRIRAVLETGANIILNFVLGKKFGINGIIWATTISLLLFNYIYGTQITFKNYFKGISPKRYYLDDLLYFFTMIVGYIITQIVVARININNDIVSLLIRTVVAMFVSNVVFILILFNTRMYKEKLKGLCISNNHSTLL